MLRSGIAILIFAVSCQLCAENVEESRTISVNGSAFATVKPDIARISLSVVERNHSLNVAQQAVAKVTARVLKLLDDLGIDRRQIDSTAATVQPNYRWNRQTEEQELVGYIAARRIEVEIRDLDVLGKVIEGSVNVGVNQVSQPMLDSTERRKVYREALALAAADALKNAGVLADSLGGTLGPVIRIDAGGNRPQPQPMLRTQSAAMSMSESAPETYNAGDIRFDATVSAVFSLR